MVPGVKVRADFGGEKLNPEIFSGLEPQVQRYFIAEVSKIGELMKVFIQASSSEEVFQ